MEKKYIMTDETITVNDHILHRIKAIRDFNGVKAGDLGGFIESEDNLSNEGFAWVYNNACVYGEARVYGEAQVCGDARVCDEAQVYDEARVYGEARVCGDARVCDEAQVYDKAWIYGEALVCDEARVCDEAQVYDKAWVYGEARVYGEAWVYGEVHCISDISNDTEESIRVQTGLIPVNGEVIAYKQVNKDLTSFYDRTFKYEIGKWVEAENPDESNASCVSGLHFSNANYWNGRENVKFSTFLIAKIKLEDIITVQAGKIRCRKAFILGKYDINEN